MEACGPRRRSLARLDHELTRAPLLRCWTPPSWGAHGTRSRLFLPRSPFHHDSTVPVCPSATRAGRSQPLADVRSFNAANPSPPLCLPSPPLLLTHSPLLQSIAPIRRPSSPQLILPHSFSALRRQRLEQGARQQRDLLATVATFRNGAWPEPARRAPRRAPAFSLLLVASA